MVCQSPQLVHPKLAQMYSALLTHWRCDRAK